MLIHTNVNRTFSITPIGGLGNRILALAASIRLINKGYYNDFRINWFQTHDLDAQLDEILTVDSKYILGPPYPENPVLTLSQIGDIAIPTTDKINICHFGTFQTIYDDTDVTPEFIEACSKIKHSQRIIDAASTIDTKNTIAIHCRRSDFWSNNHETAARIAIDLDHKFAQYLLEKYPTEQLYLSTDSPYTLIHFEKVFKDRLIYYPKQLYPLWNNRNNPCMIEAAVEHYLLSQSKMIIADSNSTYSTTAAWMAGKQKELWKP